MSWFDFGSPQADIDRGREALKYFHNASVGYPGYRESLDTLISKVGGKFPDLWMTNFGSTIRELDMSSGQVSDAMEALAVTAQGGIPNQFVFFKALSDRIQNISAGDWVKGLPEIAGNTALDAVHGAQEVGGAVLDLGKSLLRVGPILAFGAIIFIGWAYTKRAAGAPIKIPKIKIGGG